MIRNYPREMPTFAGMTGLPYLLFKQNLITDIPVPATPDAGISCSEFFLDGPFVQPQETA